MRSYVPAVEGQANRANNREELINCNTGIPSLDASLYNQYTKEERIELVDKIFSKTKPKRKIPKKSFLL